VKCYRLFSCRRRVVEILARSNCAGDLGRPSVSVRPVRGQSIFPLFEAMNMLPGDEATNAITEKIIGCPFRVRDKLKCGFLEKVYEKAERSIRPRATKKRPRTYLTDRPATRTRRNFSHGRAGQTRTVNSIRQKSTKLSASPLFWVLPEIRARPCAAFAAESLNGLATQSKLFEIFAS
jgi:hypothetical protein